LSHDVGLFLDPEAVVVDHLSLPVDEGAEVDHHCTNDFVEEAVCEQLRNSNKEAPLLLLCMRRNYNLVDGGRAPSVVFAPKLVLDAFCDCLFSVDFWCYRIFSRVFGVYSA
jgi:hypothetical protein